MDFNYMAVKSELAAQRGDPVKVFDWDKAAALIRKNEAIEAEAGLEEDWTWTCSTIYEDGKPILDIENFIVSSNWATPTLRMKSRAPTGLMTVTVPCYLLETEAKDDDVWPPSALAILEGKDNDIDT